VASALSPDVAERLLQLRADAETQARIDLLAEKCTEGELSDDERVEYETYVRTGDIIAHLQSKARSLLKSRNGG
jgi:hypothetical protein